MKKIVFLSFLFFITGSLYCQVDLIKDANGNILGYEENNLTIKNINSVPVVIMQDSLTIADPSGIVIATYNTALKELRYTNNDLLFSINTSNEIIDVAGNVKGYIQTGGKIYNNNNDYLGEGPDIEVFKLVYFFFFK